MTKSSDVNIAEVKILDIKKLNVTVEGKHVIHDLNLTAHKGEVIAIMGPNGSGKSTLAHALMGHPKYVVTGEILLDGEDIKDDAPDQRSKKGLFLSFQHPLEIPGVTVSNFLRTAINSRREKKDNIKLVEFMKKLTEKMDELHIPRSFASRYVNEGFSGGEKKKMEILQLAMLDTKVAVLDETDSGLDIDALKKVCEGINSLKAKNPDLTVILITHYQRMLNYLNPDRICILLDGEIVKIGDKELVHTLEKEGYDRFKK